MFGHLGQIAAEAGGSAQEHQFKWRDPVGHIEAEASNIGNPVSYTHLRAHET